MRTARQTCESNCYHIMVRGVGQQLIFENVADKSRYLDLLKSICIDEGIELLAWCLMDNHVHILVASPMENISHAMRRIGSGYALYFNLVHGRSGHLFQGRFKSEAVDSDAYLMTVIRYIHQNPMKAGLAVGCDYQWSSYNDYLAGRFALSPIDVVGIFGGMDQFVSFHTLDGQEDKILDVATSKTHLDDDRALTIAKSLAGGDLGNIKGMDPAKRNATIAAFKDAGLGVRQIQRLTGISLGTISKA